MKERENEHLREPKDCSFLEAEGFQKETWSVALNAWYMTEHFEDQETWA